MSFGAVAISAGATAFNVGSSLYGANKQRKAEKQLRADLFGAAGDVGDLASEYVAQLEKLNTDFDPYDMEQAFNSLYEAVIQPMERDFDENVLPGIQAAYSGGVMGASAGLSGAAQEAESNARRDLSESKAQLRFQERGQAIARNYGEYDRRANLAGTVFNAKTAAPMMRANMAPTMYGASTDTIAATLAANNAIAQAPMTLLSQAAGTKTNIQDILKK